MLNMYFNFVDGLIPGPAFLLCYFYFELKKQVNTQNEQGESEHNQEVVDACPIFPEMKSPGHVL
jgi:hypothetical protein